MPNMFAMKRRSFVGGLMAASAVVSVPALAKPKPKRFIMPSLTFCDDSDRWVHNNTWTTRYKYMDRIDPEAGTWECAKVDSDRYRGWLLEDGPFDILPHIGFGGGVVTIPGGDPTFFARWEAYARTLS